MLDKLYTWRMCTVYYTPVNFFSIFTRQPISGGWPSGDYIVPDPPHHPPRRQRVLVTAAIVPAALFLRALQPTLPLPPFSDRSGPVFETPATPPILTRPTRTILYCYYNDTLLCLNIWVRILLKPYSLSALVYVCVVCVTSVCARWRRSPAELVKTLINIYYGKPTSRILFTRFLTSLRGFMYTRTGETRHFLLLYTHTHTI